MGMRMESLRARVGATFLDVVRPGWAEEINVDRLELGGDFNGFGVLADYHTLGWKVFHKKYGCKSDTDSAALAYAATLAAQRVIRSWESLGLTDAKLAEYGVKV